MDTIIVPSSIEGEEFFLNELAWEKISISKEKLTTLKYIALYIRKPVYKIKYYATINKIEEYIIPFKYRNNIKYRLFFEQIREVDIILDDSGNRKLIIQSPRYSSIEKIRMATKISELFNNEEESNGSL